MTTKAKPGAESRRPRLKKETLRGLGFEELDQVRGGKQQGMGAHGKPIASRFCLEP